MAKAGIIERAGGGLYALEASVRGYCEHLRRIVNEAGDRGPNRARSRRDQGHDAL